MVVSLGRNTHDPRCGNIQAGGVLIGIPYRSLILCASRVLLAHFLAY